MDNFEATMQKYYEQRKEELRTGVDKLRAVFLYLKGLHPELQRIEIEYDGCGDSGQVGYIAYYSGPTSKLEIDDSQPLPDVLANGRRSRRGKWISGQGYVEDEADINISASDLLQDRGWDVAYGQNPGFEINEGAYGTITISSEINNPVAPNDVDVKLEHSERYIETTDYSYEL